MKKPPPILLNVLTVVAVLYVLFCLLLYLKQERLIFYPDKLTPTHTFHFEQVFEEITIRSQDGTKLHGLLFKSRQQSGASFGLIFFLHGNAGSLNSWGSLAPVYSRLGYDVFMLDYRGYGKSEGSIESEAQFYADAQAAYQHMSNLYPENRIVVAGISLGTGAAAMLASRNQPRMLLLLTPYYSLTDMMRHMFPLVPPFLLKYKFSTHGFLDHTAAPVYILHGTEDEVIPYASGLKLQAHLKPGDCFFSLPGAKHNNIHDNATFMAILEEILQSQPTGQ